MSRSLLADAPQETQVAPPLRLAVSGGLIAIAFVVSLAHLPLLMLHGRYLWAREHYQFFPFLLPAAFALAYRNVRGLGPLMPGRRGVCLALFGLALAFLTLGILIRSAWSGAVAAQVTLLAAAFSLGGCRLVGRLLPAWLLLFLAIPLPGPLDGRFIAVLQRLTSIGASRVLEVAGVLHARDGNVVDLGGYSILVEEACSGVHSLYSVMACTMFWSAWKRRPMGHALLLLLAALPWVLAGNVARIVAVATLDGVGGVNLSSGWGHEALGFCLFAAMLGLIWSTDHLLFLLTPLIQIPWRQLWKDLTTPMVEEEADDEHEKTFPSQPPAAAVGAKPTRLPPLAATALSAWPILACYSILAVAEAGVLGSQIRGFSFESLAPVALPADTVQALETLEESTLPQRFGTWTRASFEVSENSIDHPMGRYSRTWRYLNGEQSALAAIFYPYSGWKEVPGCYAALGWTVQNRVIHDAGPASETGPYVTARLYHSGKKRHGYLMFQNRDADGRPLTSPAEEFGEYVWTRLAVIQSWRARTGVGSAPPTSPTYLVQVFLESPSPLDLIEEQEAEALYQQVLRVLPK